MEIRGTESNRIPGNGIRIEMNRDRGPVPRVDTRGYGNAALRALGGASTIALPLLGCNHLDRLRLRLDLALAAGGEEDGRRPARDEVHARDELDQEARQ